MDIQIWGVVMARKICVITGTRAEFGLLEPIMRAIQAHSQLELSAIVTGMHLLPQFGNTYKEVEAKFSATKIQIIKVPYTMQNDTAEGMVKSIGESMVNLSAAYAKVKPELILILGDRTEILAAAISAAYMTIPLAHVHGGDKSAAGLDESARHAITKFANIHFPATKKSAERIKKLGEDPWRIHVVGAPGLDSILHEERMPKKELEKLLGISFAKTTILVVQHPNTFHPDTAPREMQMTLNALDKLKTQSIIIYPNNDAGGRRMIDVIAGYKRPWLKAYASLPHTAYLGLMEHAHVLVGNSSSGIIESASFKLPVVNIGERQEGREKAKNVIDVPYDEKKILGALTKAISPAFKKSLHNLKSPYGNGTAGKKIANILAEVKFDERLIKKKITY
jgi:UDP-hydrolysing UDP-N-acetyl-D-glucosamine 2-epimerase